MEKDQRKQRRKKQKERWMLLWNLFRCIWCAAPFFLGVYGYLQVWSGQYLNSLYAALALYGASCGVAEPNLYLEIARWWAILVTASGLVMLIRPLRKKISRLWIQACGGTIIYGSGFYAEKLAEDIRLEEDRLISRVLLTEEMKVTPAERHVLMCGSGIENFLFYENNKTEFEGSQVYINVETVYPVGVTPREVNVFSFSEGIARLYWKAYPIFPCKGEDKTIKKEIGLVGFDNLGQNLLVYGLLRNIYDENQTIVYHVWGKTDANFVWQHRRLAEPLETGGILFPDGSNDRVIFHEEEWSSPEGIAQIKELDRLILCADHENSKNLARLLYILSTEEVQKIGGEKAGIHIKLGEGEGFVTAEDVKKQICFFGRHEDIATKECIIQESLLQEAKELNYQYKSKRIEDETAEPLEVDTKQHQQNVEEAWDDVGNFFERYSNIAAADYKGVLTELLKEVLEQTGDVSKEERIRLANLEHIRWCRFHWWNNWSEGAKEKAKNSDARLHPFLCPYQELSEKEQKYDLDRVNDCLRTLEAERKSHQKNEKKYRESEKKYKKSEKKYKKNEKKHM